MRENPFSKGFPTISAHNSVSEEKAVNAAILCNVWSDNGSSMKRFHNALVIFLSVILLAVTGLISSEVYRVRMFDKLEEYNSYTTQNGKYTVSLRNSSEAGMSGAMRLSVYLVYNDSGHIKYKGKKRLDYYDDFTPYVKFSESSTEVIITFYTKYSESRFTIHTK